MRVAVAVAVAVAGLFENRCNAYTLKTADKPPPAVRDDKLAVEGRVCSDAPKPLEFPLKVLFITDTSQSMNITDPPPPTCTATACLARRGQAVYDVITAYPPGNGVEYSLMQFNGAAGVLVQNAAGNDGFTADASQMIVRLPLLNTGASETNYEAGLTTAFRVLQADMLALDSTARSRARYVVVFMSDGLPAPVTATSNTNARIRDRVLAIKALERDQRLAQVQLHTVYLSGPTTPPAVQLVATNLLEDMARAGDGTFRSFAAGEPISFFYIDFRAFIRTFAMKSFVVLNASERTQGTLGMPDSDADGLLDTEEEDPGTDPHDRDSDDDGFSDMLEVRLRNAGFDPNFSGDGDCSLPQDKLDDDGDGLLNCEERFIGSNPRLYDSDADGIGDDVEFYAGSNAAQEDTLTDADFDGVRTGNELAVHTDPSADDSGNLSQIGYRYTVKETPSSDPGVPESVRCYDFAVENITLAPTEANGTHPDGTNVVYLTLTSAPLDAPDDFGNHRIACILPRFTLVPERKVPASGRMTVPLEAFKKPFGPPDDPEVFNAARDCISP
ncbi:MAG: VWA domain-containing protein [Deltaproteobacteria bacterium]|nr:VWA domain-containing protein [Deltaproteobacteria bacterium]